MAASKTQGTKTEDLQGIINKALELKVDDVAPTYRKKLKMSEEKVQKIIESIMTSLGINETQTVLIGIILLFLQGAASEGTPLTLSVQIGEKTIEKRNIITACEFIEGHKYIRRIAEAIALTIGDFADKNNLTGEFAQRINNKLKAESGETLTPREMAFCSSFSQSIPNLEEITTPRLVKLLAEDYSRRFDNKKKENKPEAKNKKSGKNKRNK